MRKGLSRTARAHRLSRQRNIAIFSTDMDSFDFKMRKPEQVRQSVMEKLKKHSKGIVLVHDLQRATAESAMDLLNDLKAGGYKIVYVRDYYASPDARIVIPGGRAGRGYSWRSSLRSGFTPLKMAWSCSRN
jgi:hypothetical protein